MKYEFKDCIGGRFRRISRIVDVEFRKQLSSYGITESQLSILFVLRKKENIEQGKIGDILLLQRSTISRNIKLLEKLNLIKKNDKYRPSVSLTKKGIRLVKELTPVWENIMDTLTEILGGKGLKCLAEIESRIF